jgi:hypothetical protein
MEKLPWRADDSAFREADRQPTHNHQEDSSWCKTPFYQIYVIKAPLDSHPISGRLLGLFF